jgi:hypothetical protein
VYFVDVMSGIGDDGVRPPNRGRLQGHLTLK